jgi:hypothetical protein
MNVYSYNAALYCEWCGAGICDQLDDEGVEDDGDFETYPQGPISDGGGESDCPNHCDGCHGFLENPLTTEGYAYVKEAISAHATTGRGNAKVIAEWKEFYGISLISLDDDTEE